MKIVNEWPPNIKEIRQKLDVKGFNPVFTWGDVLYNPTGGSISEDLMAHEETHQRQQAILGTQDWWAAYLQDDGFRLKQELEAYQQQYKFMRDWPRNIRRAMLRELASNLSSKLYGSIVNKNQAMEFIRQYE